MFEKIESEILISRKPIKLDLVLTVKVEVMLY